MSTCTSPQVTLTGDSLFWPGSKPEVKIERGLPRSGIVFVDQGKNIPLNLNSLHANQSLIGARYLYVGEGKRKAVRVPEHLLSAMFWRNVDDVKVTASKQQIPLDGPGIKAFYDHLAPLSSPQATRTRSHFYVARPMTFAMVVKGIEVTVEATPSRDDTLNIQVLSGRHRDLPDLCEKPFELIDAPLQAPDHLRARAIARLQNSIKYRNWRLVSSLGYGINHETYLVAAPGDTAKDIRRKMQPEYQDNGNEHLAHTAVCDFPGELLAAAPKISGNFVLQNTNHLTRVAAIRFFVKRGVLVEKQF